MGKYILKVILLVSVCGFSTLLWAAKSQSSTTESVTTETAVKDNIVKEDPIQFLHAITDKVLTQLKHHRDNGSHKVDEEIHKIVNNLILPNVDFEEMGKWIAGRNNWSKASESDRDEFIAELKKLLTRTYSTTLNNYNEEKIEFQNYNGDRNLKRIQIKSTVTRPDRDNLAVDYRLIANDHSWKVYDVIIEGVSILQGFQAQFSDDIRMHGLKSVTAKIRNRNNKSAEKSSS